MGSAEGLITDNTLDGGQCADVEELHLRLAVALRQVLNLTNFFYSTSTSTL